MRTPLLLVFCLLIMISITSSANADEVKLIVRGDDLGMTQGSIAAFHKAFDEGVLTCASVIVPAPWFEAARDLIVKHPGWCIGIHLTLIGEWRGYRWRPVLPWSRVRSIVDEDGFLYRYPEELLSKKPKAEEIEAEWRVQIDLAIKKGINVQYLDFHYMGPEGLPGLTEAARRIASDYHFPISGALGERVLPDIYMTPIGKKTERAVKTLEDLKPALWLWIFHPGIDSPEHSGLIHTKPEDAFKGDSAGKHRAAETETLTSPLVRAAIRNRGIKLTAYGTVWRELQGKK